MNLLILTGLIVTAISCSKQNIAANTDLYGTWKWVSTDGGIAFQVHENPQSTGKNIDLKLTENGQYAFYTNGAVTTQGTYSIEIKKCIHDNTNKRFINFSSNTGNQGMMVESISDGNLSLSDENFDGVGSLYSKK